MRSIFLSKASKASLIARGLASNSKPPAAVKRLDTSSQFFKYQINSNISHSLFSYMYAYGRLNLCLMKDTAVNNIRWQVNLRGF